MTGEGHRIDEIQLSKDVTARAGARNRLNDAVDVRSDEERDISERDRHYKPGKNGPRRRDCGVKEVAVPSYRCTAPASVTTVRIAANRMVCVLAAPIYVCAWYVRMCERVYVCAGFCAGVGYLLASLAMQVWWYCSISAKALALSFFVWPCC